MICRFLFSFFLFAFSSAAYSQQSKFISDDSTGLKIPADTSAFCIIEMKDGTLIKGKVIGQKSGQITFRDNNLGIITLKTKNISYIEQGGSNMYFLFYMKDGSLLRGEIIRQNETEIEIKTKKNSSFSDSTQKKIIIPVERIKEMKKVNEKDFNRKGKYRYPNMNAPRYFFCPSAIPVKQDEGYYQTVDFLVNNFNFELTKNISISGGAVLPLAIFVMPKYGRKVTDVLYLGAGALYGQTMVKFRKTNFKTGALCGLATFGNTNSNLTFGCGYAFSDVNHQTDLMPKPILLISGTLRISRRFAFVGENVIIPFKNTFYTAEGKMFEYDYKNSSVYGLRFMKENFSLDFGLLHYPQDVFKAFPYLDFTIKF